MTNIFFDLDETLVRTENLYALDADRFEYAHFHCAFSFELSQSHYACFIRPGARQAIEYARSLVGEDRVFMLTLADRAYAEVVDTEAGFGFGPDRIFCVPDFHFKTDNNLDFLTSLKSPHNILIDNLKCSWNDTKVDLIGMDRKNYVKVDDFYEIWNPNYRYKDFFPIVKENLKHLKQP